MERGKVARMKMERKRRLFLRKIRKESKTILRMGKIDQTPTEGTSWPSDIFEPEAKSDHSLSLSLC